jgi:hypothetical protein
MASGTLWERESLPAYRKKSALCSWRAYKLTARCKTRAWVEAVLGHQLRNGESIQLEDLKALDCFVLITHDENGFARIENVLPLPKRSASKAAIKPAPPAETDGGDDGVEA